MSEYLGSCWALSVMYSGVAGSHHPQDTANHLKDRIKTSYLDLATLDELVNTPTNKVRHPLHRLVVDIYCDLSTSW